MVRITKQDRHIRWNWEKSPDKEEEVRYHFIVVDDKNRKGIMNKIIQPLQKWGNVEMVRDFEDKAKGTKYRFLFYSFDSNQGPKMLELHRLGKLVKKDDNLYEREVGDLEDYVYKLYGHN